MPDDLGKYIKNSLAQGVPKATIENNLLQSNWPKEKINLAFQNLNYHSPFRRAIAWIEIVLGAIGVVHLPFVFTTAAGIPLIILGVIGYRELKIVSGQKPATKRTTIVHFFILFLLLISAVLVFPYPAISGLSLFEPKPPWFVVPLWVLFNTYAISPIIVRILFLILLLFHLILVAFSSNFGKIFKPMMSGVILRGSVVLLVIFAIYWIGLPIKTEYERRQGTDQLVTLTFENNSLIKTNYKLQYKDDNISEVFYEPGMIGGYDFGFESKKISPYGGGQGSIYIFSTKADARKAFYKGAQNLNESYDRQGDTKLNVAYGDDSLLVESKNCVGTIDYEECKKFNREWGSMLLYVRKGHAIISLSHVLMTRESTEDAFAFFDAIVGGIDSR